MRLNQFVNKFHPQIIHWPLTSHIILHDQDTHRRNCLEILGGLRQNFGAYPLLQAYAIACPVSNMGLFGPKKVFAKNGPILPKKVFAKKCAYFGIQRKVIIEKRAYQNFLA